MMVSYGWVAMRLKSLGRIYGLASCCRELVGPVEGRLVDWNVGAMAMATVRAMEKLFPTHLDMVEEYVETGIIEEFLAWPMASVVHFEGLEGDGMEWEDWDEGFKLGLVLEEAGSPMPYPSYFSEEAVAWWEELAGEYELPPLGMIDVEGMRRRIGQLPGPWAGLDAILTWIEGDSGNLFVDIPCSQVGTMDFGDLDWSVENIRYLEREYREAREKVFEPAWKLCGLIRQDLAALRMCLDLALGRVDAEIADGELIVMERKA